MMPHIKRRRKREREKEKKKGQMLIQPTIASAFDVFPLHFMHHDPAHPLSPNLVVPVCVPQYI